MFSVGIGGYKFCFLVFALDLQTYEKTAGKAMKITFNSFLGCLKLETGGLIIGWFHLIINILALILVVVAIVILSIFDCHQLNNFMESEKSALEREIEVACSQTVYNSNKYNCGNLLRRSNSSANFMSFCKGWKGVTIGVMVIGIVVYIIVAVIAFFCIKGTKNRNHAHVKPMMILMGICAFLGALNILAFTPAGIVMGVVEGVIFGYCCIVLYSLFDVFREERERGMGIQYQAPEEPKV